MDPPSLPVLSEPRIVGDYRALALLFVGYVGVHLCRENLSVAIPLLRGDEKFNHPGHLQVGAIFTVGTIFYALGKFVTGPVVDRLGGRRSLLLSFLWVALWGATCAFAPNITALAVLYGLSRLGGSASWGAMLKITATWFGPARTGWALAVLSPSYIAGGTLALLLAAAITRLGGGWREVMGLPSLALAVILVLCFFTVRAGPLAAPVGEPSRKKPALIPLLRALLRQPPFLMICLLSFTLTLTRDAFLLWSVDFFTEGQILLGFLPHDHPQEVAVLKETGVAALKATWFGLPGIFSILAAGRVFDRLRPSRRRWLMAGCLAISAMAIAALSLDSVRRTWAVPLVAVVGFLVYGPYSLLAGAFAVDYSGVEARATAAGIIDGMGYLGGALAGAALGRLIEVGGYELGFRILALLTVISAFASLGLAPALDPIVVRIEATPGDLKSFPLPALPDVDRALRRARRLDASLSIAGLPPARWQRALSTDRLKSFAEALGATLHSPIPNIPPSTRALDLRLPGLRLRFAEQTSVVLLEGRDVEAGAAAALASAIHRGGAGPRQAIALDLTETQQARARLRESLSVKFVVFTADRLRDLLLADQPAEILEATLVDQIEVADLSPYQTAGGVNKEALFFGRERELRTIADRTLRNFLLVGPRQMGKSTLLKALERRVQQRPDVEAHNVTLDDGNLTAHLARHLHAGATSGESSIEAFRALAAGTRDKPRLWLIDEADLFVKEDARRDYAITRAMRALSQDGLAYFVLTGYWHLYAATVLDRDHPLLNFAEVMRLEPLDERAARALATEPVEALGLRWDQTSTVEHLVQGMGRRANLIVIACQAMIGSLGAEDRVLTREGLDRKRRSGDLAEALLPLRAHEPLDRILVAQSFLLGTPAPEEVRAAIRQRGVDAAGAEIDRAFDRLMLGYVLLRDDGGRLECPVPFVREAIEQERKLEDRLLDDIDEWRMRRSGLS
jgi:sugar phosphate permease